MCNARDVFTLTEANGAETTSDDTAGDGDHRYLEQNPLLLTGVSLCVLVVLLSIAFVCHRQWRSRQLASKLTLTSTPAHEALLSRTATAANDSNVPSQKLVFLFIYGC